MGKVNKTKFYRPGSLEVPGTKITLKTQPYTNGVIFNTQDPISSFRRYIALISLMTQSYETLLAIPGLKETIGSNDLVASEDIGKIKLLLNYLAESPIEVILKEQQINNDILAQLEVQQNG